MSATLKSATQDEIRLKNYRASLERQNEIELRDAQLRHGNEIQKLQEQATDQTTRLHQDYEVKISQEAERLEEALHQKRLENDARLEQERLNAENEYQKAKAGHEERLHEYKKNSENQLNELQKQLQASSEALHEQARKSARKETEKNKT